MPDCVAIASERLDQENLVYRIGDTAVALGALQQVDMLAVSGYSLVPGGLVIQLFI
jgi:hypothetical protein